MDGLIEVLQGITPGKIMDVKSDAYQEFVDNSKPEEEPVKAEEKLLENNTDQKSNTSTLPSEPSKSKDNQERELRKQRKRAAKEQKKIVIKN